MRIPERADALLSGGCALSLLAFALYGTVRLLRRGGTIQPNGILGGGGWGDWLLYLIAMAGILGVGFLWRAAFKWRIARWSSVNRSGSNKGASSNGGPALPPANSGVTEGRHR